jgi:hypothetical protein
MAWTRAGSDSPWVHQFNNGHVAELVYAYASGAYKSNLVRVQIPPCPQLKFSGRCPAEALAKAGRSIPVVHILREDADWVRFPAARQYVSSLSNFLV